MYRRTISFAAAALVLAACSDDRQPLIPESPATAARASSAPAPAGRVTVTAGGATQSIWPYNGPDFTGTAQDPINLVFVGKADPRNVRNLLLALDGNRGGTPFAPFDCTWSDAIGTVMVTYGSSDGWSGSAIQLQCGPYAPFRFHVRLFRLGAWTVANAHVEVLIPGTADHQVLSWEVAEQFVAFELARAGALVAPPGRTGTINAAGGFREIPAVIYNGLPPELRALAGGPPGNVSAAIPILTDGSATVLDLGRTAAAAPGRWVQDFTLQLGQIVPKPFCNASGGEYIQIAGPVHFRQEVTVTSAGALSSQSHIDGAITVTRVDPFTGAMGTTFPAHVREQYSAEAGDDASYAAMQQFQQLVRPGATPQELHVLLRAGSEGGTQYLRDESCGQP